MIYVSLQCWEYHTNSILDVLQLSLFIKGDSADTFGMFWLESIRKHRINTEDVKISCCCPITQKHKRPKFIKCILMMMYKQISYSPTTETLNLYDSTFPLLAICSWYSPESVVLVFLMVRDPVFPSSSSLFLNLSLVPSYVFWQILLAALLIFAMTLPPNFHSTTSSLCSSGRPVLRVTSSPSITVFGINSVFINKHWSNNARIELSNRNKEIFALLYMNYVHT